ncbi:MAG: FAD-dependent oxidoreductase [Chloroflexi bacterium]|nr:FAD-dependent oxidoreductase [Chloroflexota bacterium]
MLAPNNLTWDAEADVVVIGYGLAGAVAAITARDLGASVLILEKQPAASHCTNSSLSGGLFVRPADVGGGVEYMKALCQVNPPHLWTDLDSIRVWAEYTVQNKDWMESLGGHVRLFHKGGEHGQLPGADSIEIWQYQGKGFRMMQFMYEQVKTRGIEVQYETPAQRLLTGERGEVIGVRATPLRKASPCAATHVKARKAVILCSGGFENNEDMKLQYLRVFPVYFTGGMANTGDGIRMAQEMGAQLWHMNCCSAGLVPKFPDFPLAFPIELAARESARQGHGGTGARAGFIIVDKYGRRYMDENFRRHAGSYQVACFDSNRLEYPRVPSYYVFDRRRMELGRLIRPGGAAGPHQLYKWSQDNSAELHRGWIVEGNTIAELAGGIGVAATTLDETVRTWNRHSREGNDPDFGRSPAELVPLDSPPFYAVRLYPGGPNTLGGPRRNSRSQVVNPFGEPIPGLYAAGECGSVYGMLYPSAGGNLAECIAFGRIAGGNAARETSRVG